MKQLLIEHGLWETLLNDDRFLNHLKNDNENCKSSFDILTEFKKWLEACLENEKFCYLSPHGKDRYRYDIFKECLDKLQELKEIKK